MWFQPSSMKQLEEPTTAWCDQAIFCSDCKTMELFKSLDKVGYDCKYIFILCGDTVDRLGLILMLLSQRSNTTPVQVQETLAKKKHKKGRARITKEASKFRLVGEMI